MTGSDQRKEYIVAIAEIKSGYLEAKNILKNAFNTEYNDDNDSYVFIVRDMYLISISL